ncbi:AAA family ATPase [Croceitalea sp. MTPC9]|uniref:AAA family ATPase n=1 Tax=unclassified Croceitalea TaxID=2632280 RepID=UPI002B3CF8A6|nr:AAA family ATPase [Croceitalea sp. MTPC6]GMN17677.1 AAA family ATPase [Croceitalea sp. MTPC9]
MGQSLPEIAQTLRDADKKMQLIYAFNGSGKTRLSREFKDLIAPKDPDAEGESGIKVLYYNAFTEDLFYWDNDLEYDNDRKLMIQPNSYTKWILLEQGQEPNITSHFQRYTNDKLTPRFNEQYTIKDKENKDIVVPEYSEVHFSFETGDESGSRDVKISKGEESCFVWSVFYSLLEQTINVLNVAEVAERETNQFNDLQYVFIDDPVSSLDDTHLIELAVDIAKLIKSSTSELKFIITTHNPLFYNVIFNEFNRVSRTRKWRLEKLIDSTFDLIDQPKDSPFSYHLFLLAELEKAIESGEIQKYHFNFLRNIFEKASTFLGFNKWEELLPSDARESYYNRIINLSSHSKHHGEEVSILEANDKRVLGFLVKEIIIKLYRFKPTIMEVENQENVTV